MPPLTRWNHGVPNRSQPLPFPIREFPIRDLRKCGRQLAAPLGALALLASKVLGASTLLLRRAARKLCALGFGLRAIGLSLCVLRFTLRTFGLALRTIRFGFGARERDAQVAVDAL